MQELYVILFIALISVGAYFAFKKPKKTNAWDGRGSSSGSGEQDGEQNPTSTSQTTPSSFYGDVAPLALVTEEEKTSSTTKKRSTKPRKKYGTRIKNK